MHLDGTITAGNIITIGTLVIAAIFFWARIDMKLKQIEEWIRGHDTCSLKQDQILDEITKTLSYMRGRNDASNEIRDAVTSAVRSLKWRKENGINDE